MPALRVSTSATAYQNDDVLPLPSSRRTWTRRTFVYFWLSIGVSLGSWSGASTALATGLTVGQAIGVCIISNVIIALGMVASGQAGSTWRVPFAVVNRTCWGIRGSWFVVINRVILACCWFGVDAWYGGQMIKVMIGAIWPRFYEMKNHFPESVAMRTNEFISFIIFWVVGLPLTFLKPEHYHRPALFISAMVTSTVLCIFIWALVKQGNIGPLWNEPDDKSEVRLSRSETNWTMVWMVTRGIGSWASGILYQSDFTRYARRPNDQIWGQIFVVPICFSCVNIMGIVTTSCARGLYPEEPLLWKLYDLLYAIQKNEGTAARAAVFFGSFAFFLSSLSSTMIASAVVGGIDLASLLPRYINIRRGSFLIAVIGVLINPWKILNSPNSFIAALSGYAVFLGPLTGIMLTEYHLTRQRRIKQSHLFVPDTSSDYWFWHGLNWRAPVAWTLGVSPTMPGFLASVVPRVKVNVVWMRIYYLSWFLGVALSGVAWLTLNAIWPPPGLGEVDKHTLGIITSSNCGPQGKDITNNKILEERGSSLGSTSQA